MARFASDCITKLGQIIREDLMDRLGEDTENLGMRFGLHSGSVTAGVLRGDKGRYQIFGDTVSADIVEETEST